MRLDLATEWRSRRWRRLLNIIDHLPRDSAYVEAMTQDDAFAEAIGPQPRKAGKPARRMADWSPTVEMLSAILDRLGELTQAVAALGGAKPSKFTRAPRPVTALDRVSHRRRVATHNDLVSRLLPGRRPTTEQPAKQ